MAVTMAALQTSPQPTMAAALEQDRIYNRGFLLDDTGQIRSRYTKIHMFDIQFSQKDVYRESASVEAGSELVLWRYRRPSRKRPVNCIGMY